MFDYSFLEVTGTQIKGSILMFFIVGFLIVVIVLLVLSFVAQRRYLRQTLPSIFEEPKEEMTVDNFATFSDNNSHEESLFSLDDESLNNLTGDKTAEDLLSAVRNANNPKRGINESKPRSALDKILNR